MVNFDTSHGQFDGQTDVTLLHGLSGEPLIVLLQFLFLFLRQFEEVIAIKVGSDAAYRGPICLYSWLE